MTKLRSEQGRSPFIFNPFKIEFSPGDLILKLWLFVEYMSYFQPIMPVYSRKNSKYEKNTLKNDPFNM